MSKKEKSLEKVKIILLVIIAILLLLNLFQKSGIIESIRNTSKKLLNNGEMVISEDGTVAQSVDSSNWDTSKVTAIKDADGKEVPVPKGYVGSNATGENKINEGYVIYEGTGVVNDSNVSSARTSRNQWVWVPVKYPNRIYEEVNGIKKSKLYSYTSSGRSEYQNNNLEPAILPEWDNSANLEKGGLAGMTTDKLYQELQLEFDETIKSIEKYGGFYIGRYETGNLSQSKPVVMKMNVDIRNQSWYTCYKKMGYLSANSNVKTNIIWGCLWDEILQRYVECSKTTTLIYSSILDESYRWGNFYNSSFSYVNSSWQTVTKPSNSAIVIPAGSTDYTKKLNIYDIAGNVLEWTLEGTDTAYRVVRGGAIGEKSEYRPAAMRHGWCEPSYTGTDVGCRAYLYIK